jgi:hypothetical protein
MNEILRSIFKIWNFLPLFQMLFLWLNKTPPQWKPPLSVQEGFKISILKILLSPPFEYNKIPIWNLPIENHLFLKLGGGVRSFCFGLTLSPPLAWIAKNGYFEWNISPLLTTFSPLANKTWVKIIPQTESCLERRRRMSYGVEAFVFAEDSNSLSIHLWLGLK